VRNSRLAGILAAGSLALIVAAPVAAAEPAPLTAVVAVDNGTPAAGSAWVRVLHGSPDAPEVDVLVGADLASAAKVDALSGLSFGEISDYAEVPAGTYGVKVCATADNSVCPIEVAALDIAADTKYTVAASDLLASITANVFVDAPADNADQAQVRVVHLSADTPAVDVLTQDGSATVVSDLAYPDATDYLALDAGSYDLKVCANADNSVCPLDPGALDLEAGQAYSVFAVGSLDATLNAGGGNGGNGGGNGGKDLPETDTVAAPEASGSGTTPILLLLGIAAAAGVVASRRFATARARNR
jgi:hypothetical protein